MASSCTYKRNDSGALMNGITEIYRLHLDVDNVICSKRVCDLET